MILTNEALIEFRKRENGCLRKREKNCIHSFSGRSKEIVGNQAGSF